MAYIPKIYFKYASPLDSDRRGLFASKGKAYPSFNEVKQASREIHKLWQIANKDDQLIKKLIEVLGVNPERDFEVNLYGEGLYAMSAPLLVGLYKDNERLSNDYVLDCIVHELIHNFISTNEFRPISYDTRPYWDYFWEKYSEYSTGVRNHILVYAVLQKVMSVVFSEEQIQKSWSQIGPSDYHEAIRIMEEKGSDYFIQEFRERIIHQ